MSVIVCTYNVKRLDMTNPMSVVELLQKYNVDICGLQEVPGRHKLGLLFRNTEYACIFDDLYYTYGNGLVYNCSKFKLVSTTTHILKDKRNKKSLLHVQLVSTDNEIIDVFVTHLDHRSESQRMIELEKLVSIEKPSKHILMGDFNSLSKTDMDMSAWNSVMLSRRINGIENCPYESRDTLCTVTDRLLTEYTDTLSEPKVLFTCIHRTRVDYIYVKGIESTNGFVVNDILNESDHSPVISIVKL